MERQPHYLDFVGSNRGPGQVCTVEAVPTHDGACAWHAIFARCERGEWTRRKERHGTNAAEWWAWLWSVGAVQRRLWVFAAKWATVADSLDLVGETTFGDGKLGKHVVSEGCTLIELDKRDRCITLVDAANWWDKLPSWLDVSKADVPDPVEWCKARAERLWALVTRSIDLAVSNDLGVIQPTIGSWASNVWRHWHRGQRVVTHTDPDALRLERRSYFGGQCIVHKKGRLSGPFTGVDCNMMYPWSMAYHLQPYSLLAFNPKGDVRLLETLPRSQGAIAEVEIASPDWTYPVKVKGGLIAARGTFWTTLAWPELSFALARGHVRSVRACSIYYLTDLFSVWANRLWAIRLESRANGQDDFGTLVKRLGAALHGKLGQHGAEWVEGNFPCVRPWGWWPSMQPDHSIKRRRAIGLNVAEKWQSEEEPHDSFPAIAAWTTSGARLRMAQLREIAGREHWIYQYSDQLVVDADGFSRLTSAGEICPATLGAFKEEFNAAEVEIRGPGWIMHDGRRRAAGIGQAAKETEPDRYYIQYHQSLAGKVGPKGPRQYKVWSLSVHVPSREVSGVTAADGFIDPPTL